MISGYGPSDNPYLADATGIAMADVCALGSPEDPADAYQLKTESAAIDIGRDDAVPSYVYEVDLAGNPRIVNAAIDIGAFEHQGP